MTQKTPVPEFWWKQDICCTCEYWGGERDLDFQNAKLMYIRAQYNPQPRHKHNLEQKEAGKITYLAEYWFTISDFMS